MAEGDAVLKAVLRMEDLASATLASFGRKVGAVEKQTSASVSKMDGVFSRFGQNLTKYALGFVSFAAGAAAIRRAVKSFFETDTEFARIAASSYGAAENIDALKDAVADLSSEFGRSSVQVAAGAYVAVKETAGDARQSLALLTDGARLARAVFSETGQGVSALATVMDSFGIKIEQRTTRKVSDLLVRLSQLSEAELPELSALLGNLLVPARQAGISLEEIGAALATMLSAGLPARQVFSELGAIIGALSDPSSELADNANRLGFGMEFLEARGRGLTAILDLLHERVGGNVGIMRELIGSQSAAIALTELTGDRYGKFSETLHGLKTGLGDTARAIERSKTSTEGLRRVLNELSLSSKAAFGALVEGIDSLGPGDIGLFDAWADIFRGVREAMTPLSDSAKELERATLDLNEAMESFNAAKFAGDISAQAVAYERVLSAVTRQEIAQKALNKSLEDSKKIGETVVFPESAMQRRLDAINGELDATIKLNLAIEQQRFAWEKETARAIAAGEITTEQQEKELEAIEKVIDALLMRAKIEGKTANQQRDVFTATQGDDFGASFAANFKQQSEQLKVGQLGAQAASETFGLLTGAVDGFSRELASGERNYKRFFDGLKREVAAMIIKFAILRAVSSIFFPQAAAAESKLSVPVKQGERGGTIYGGMIGRAAIPRAYAEQLGRSAIPIRAYERGGIADTPQVAIFGRHGRTQAEAFVPLGGDRKIPVKLVSGRRERASEGTMNVSISITSQSLDPRTAGDVILSQMPMISERLAQEIQSGRRRSLNDAVREVARR